MEEVLPAKTLGGARPPRAPCSGPPAPNGRGRHGVNQPLGAGGPQSGVLGGQGPPSVLTGSIFSIHSRGAPEGRPAVGFARWRAKPSGGYRGAQGPRYFLFYFYCLFCYFLFFFLLLLSLFCFFRFDFCFFLRRAPGVLAVDGRHFARYLLWTEDTLQVQVFTVGSVSTYRRI